MKCYCNALAMNFTLLQEAACFLKNCLAAEGKQQNLPQVGCMEFYINIPTKKIQWCSRRRHQIYSQSVMRTDGFFVCIFACIGTK
jgi:hypothetical protein